MLAVLKDLRAASQEGANCAMVACVQAICEAREGRNAAGILAESLRAEIAKLSAEHPSAFPMDKFFAFLEGYCDTLQKFIEAQGLGQKTITPPEDLR